MQIVIQQGYQVYQSTYNPSFLNVAHFPISKYPIATLSMSASTTSSFPRLELATSMSWRHSFSISNMAWYCLEEDPNVLSAFSRLLDILPYCYSRVATVAQAEHTLLKSSL